MSNRKLRFAPIARVSTEKQRDKGESLKTQKKEIKRCVESLNGEIVTWDYSGQAHATSQFEKRKLDQLLEDASKDIFDAVIVVDPSRWSRDNRKSKEGLEILRENGIRFFVKEREYDLWHPEDKFMLGMFAEINEMGAYRQQLKSLTNRIERANQNIPTAGGNLPYARTFDRETNTWGLNKEKQKTIINAVNRYLEGEKVKDIAKTLDMSKVSLWKILKHYLGPKWTISFKSKELNIEEEVTLDIPPLVDDETRQCCRKFKLIRFQKFILIHFSPIFNIFIRIFSI
jgi:DNA invertase Pin-like site-specific DNA recombinase